MLWQRNIQEAPSPSSEGKESCHMGTALPWKRGRCDRTNLHQLRERELPYTTHFVEVTLVDTYTEFVHHLINESVRLGPSQVHNNSLRLQNIIMIIVKSGKRCKIKNCF